MNFIKNLGNRKCLIFAILIGFLFVTTQEIPMRIHLEYEGVIFNFEVFKIELLS
jgi:hypothetical protein